MRTRRRTPLAALLAAALCAPGAFAQDAPPEVDAQPEAEVTPGPDADVLPAETPEAQPAESGLVVYDLAVMQADLYGVAMNDRGDFDSTLFNDAPRRRPVSDDPLDTPMPLGLISLAGSIDRPTTIRLDLVSDTGRFLGHWPKGTAGSRLLMWHDIRQVETPAGRQRVNPEHWLSPMRDTEAALAFNARNQVDRVFAYDPMFPFEPTLKVEGKREEGYRLTGEAPAGTLHAVVVRRDPDGWRVGMRNADSLLGPIELAPVAGPDEAIAPILAHLQDLGYHEAARTTAARILRETAFGDASMSLIYVVNEQTLNAVLPLSVVPAPAAIHRVGIIVVNNVEPDIANTVGGLIEQLGDDRWATRDAAQRALIEMDRAAIELVRQNADHDDPEVAYRIEQIIAAYEERHE